VDAAEIPKFSREIHQRRDAIAQQWYTALVSFGSLILDRDEALQKFTQLTDQVIAFLLAEAPDKSAAREVGGNLVRLRCIEPQVIETTGQLWTRQVVECASQDEIAQLYPRLVVLLNGMATGLIIGVRQVVLDEQEQIRLAMATNLLRTTEELRKYQSQLEAMLAERTRDLRESEERFRLIAETSLDGIFQSTDPTGRLIFVNDAFARMLGYTKEELLGRNTLDLMADEDSPKLPAISQTVAKEMPAHGEYRLKHKDGHLVHVHFSVVSMRLKGKVIRSGILQDITERKRAEEALRESEERYRKLIEASQDLIYIFSREGRIEYVNSIATSSLGLTPEDMIGQPMGRFTSKANVNKLKHNIEQIYSSGEAKSVEDTIKFPRGKTWLSTWLIPLRDSSGKINAILGVSRDITNYKQVETSLQRAKNELEKRVAERTASLSASQEQLRKLTQQIVNAQEEERRRVSRELHDEAGQMLITLKYSLDSVINELPDNLLPISQRLSEAITWIDHASEHIRSLSHSLRPPVLDIAGINLSLKDYCREFSEQTKIHVQYRSEDMPGLPDAVGISLYRFVQEAFANILKHAHASQVRVGLRYRKDMIVLSVADNGIGMSDDWRSRSTGIGLLGLEERLNLLGGSLKIHSKPGQGTRITAYVPWPTQ